MNFTGNAMIFRKDKDGKFSYTVGLSRKNEEGKYENAYFPVKFRKGVELENQARIDVTNAFLTFNKYKNAEGKDTTYIYLMITEFNQASKVENKGNNDPFADFGSTIKADEIELGNEELPF